MSDDSFGGQPARWQSASTRPDENVPVLAYLGEQGLITGFCVAIWTEAGMWRNIPGLEQRDLRVLAWSPLPAPPTDVA